MKTSDFSFELPAHLIAQYPLEARGQSRLMTLNRLTGKRQHRMVENLPEILSTPELRSPDGKPPLLVFNNSKVRKARLVGVSLDSGASVEFLLLEKVGSGEWGVVSRGKKGNREQGTGTRDCYSGNDIASGIYPDNSNNDTHSPLWRTLVQRSKRRKNGSRYAFYDGDGAEIARAEIAGSEGEFRFLSFDRDVDDAWLDRYGHIPLPPYIKRQDAPSDADRYQTVYAASTGSAAAPTAGLHFTRELLDRLASAGIETAFITLHVGLGTFLPVRSARIEDHVMHSESFAIDEQTAAKIESAKAQGRKIVAVGTTTARTLESAWPSPYRPLSLLKQTCLSSNSGFHRGSQRADSNQETQLDAVPFSVAPLPKTGATSIFIYPGYRFNIVDALFTNFHTPESTLLMLVSAFAGRELILESYAEAIGEGYRFFSYGDAMLIL